MPLNLVKDVNMTDRTYRLIFGALLLIFLYFNIRYGVYAIVAMMLLEGATNWRVPHLINKLRGLPEDACSAERPRYRFNVEAERVWRVLIGLTVGITYVFFSDLLWFVPWFLGFVLFSAGISDVCPGLAAVKKAGFK
jgi:hypothetical protein